MGGGICQHTDEWYRNWEFDYKPPDEEVVQEEPGDIQQEAPKVPQDHPEGEAAAEQIEDAGGRKSTTTRRSSARQGASRCSSAQQGKPSQPKPPCPPMHSRPQTDPESSTLTRQQQRGRDPLAPLSPEESKTRENNIAHMRHLREAMKN